MSHDTWTADVVGRGDKPYKLKQDKFIALSYADQIVPGSFEYAINEIVEALGVSSLLPIE